MSELTGLDAELYDALAECGRIVEAMPHDQRHEKVERFLAENNLLEGRYAKDFLIGVFVVAHETRLWRKEHD